MCAVVKGAQIKLGAKECVLGMGQNRRSHCAVAKDVHGAKIKLCSSSEGCTNRAVKGGVCKRHGAKVNAAVKDAPLINPDDEECALGRSESQS